MAHLVVEFCRSSVSFGILFLYQHFCCVIQLCMPINVKKNVAILSSNAMDVTFLFHHVQKTSLSLYDYMLGVKWKDYANHGHSDFNPG